MIPKIIHYCWLSGDSVPDKLQACMNSWKEKIPDYEFMLWDLNRFDINSSLWVKEAYEAKKYAFAADYIRLYALYKYGGVYMDMDVEVLRPFGELLDRDYMLAYESDKGIEAGIMGSIPEADWLKKCLEYYENRHFIKPDGTLDTCPLPKILFDILRKDYSGFTILSPDFFTTKSMETGKICCTKNSYTIHHFAGSWCTWQGRLKRFLYLLIARNRLVFSLYKRLYRKH